MLAYDIPDLAIIRDPEAAVALLDPERRRLTEALAAEADSASGLARRLGEKRQRLNYHLRVLEEVGLVEAVEAGPRGSRSERVLRPTARRFVLDPAAIGHLAAAQPALAGDRFSATYLVALAARAIRDLAELLERAGATRARIATASINSRIRLPTPAHFDAFVVDLTESVARAIARHHQAGGDGRWFRVIGCAYPGPTTNSTEEEVNHG
jgi:DNA-binding transcriptional ArsR family regulator